MATARRIQRIAEDAGDESVCYTGYGISDSDIEPLVVPLWPEMGELQEEYVTPTEDAMAHAVDASESWPRFYCESCGTHNEGRWLNCAMCGEWREDLDAL